jgi:hypothetical protein
MKKKDLIRLQPVLLISTTLRHQLKKELSGNKFSCRINGEVFKPVPYGFKSEQVFGGYSNNFSTVRITARCSRKHPFKYLTMELNNYNGIGEYDMSDNDNRCTYEEFYPDNTYKSILTKSGKITIVKDDRINFFVAGYFEFKAANTSNSSDVVNITKGFFDMEF